MKYLNTKPGSIEEIAANMSKHQNESGYQDMFKKELEKAGKGIGAMTPAEKKAFFNKIDDKYKAKNEDIKEGRYEVTGTVTYQGVSGEDEVTVVVDAMDKMDAEDVADDMIDDLRSKKKIGPKRGGQVKAFYPFDVEYTRKKEGLVDKMMEKSDKQLDTFHKKLDNLVHKTIGKSSDEKKEAVNEKKNYKRDSNFFVNDKTDTLKKMSGRQGYNKSTLTDYLAQKSDKKEDDVYFDDTDLVYKDKTVLKNAETKTVDQMLKALQKEAVDNPYAVGMAQAMKKTGDKPPLKKSTITKAHDIAKSIEKDEKNEEKDVPKGYHKMPDGTVMKDSEHKKETHSFMTKDMNKSKKDAKGEKEIVDPEPKMKQESIQDAIANVWKMSAEELEKIKTEAKYMKAQRMSQYRAEKDEKNKKGTADTGSKMTPVDVEPKVDYKN
jgi:hypothetical protein